VVTESVAPSLNPAPGRRICRVNRVFERLEQLLLLTALAKACIELRSPRCRGSQHWPPVDALRC
jgi:hypothetical protein